MIDSVRLVAALKGFGLSTDSIKKICDLCEDLHRFERDDKPKMKTTAQRVKSLQSIAAKARELRNDLDALDVGDWLSLDTSLCLREPSPEVVPLAQGAKSLLGAHAVYMQRMLCILSAAAAGASVNVSGGRMLADLGGRKPTLGAYAGFIAGMAVIVKGAGICAGRGGDFERICGLVFEFAGIHSKPEGALRYYLKHIHPEYLSRGFAL